MKKILTFLVLLLISATSINGDVINTLAVPIPTVTKHENIEVKANKEIQDTNNSEKKIKENKTEDVISQPKDDIAETRELARFLYTANDIDESLKKIEEIPENKRTSDDWLLISNIMQDKNKVVDAVFYLKKAIQTDEKNYKAHYNLGNLYFADNKNNLATESFTKSIKYKKTFSYAYYNRGCCYLKEKKYGKAKYQFGLAIKNNPDEPIFYYNLAYTYKMLNKTEKANEALKVYEKLMTE